MSDIPSSFRERLRAAADQISGMEGAQVVSHTDADGVSSAAVASRALERAGVGHDVVFFKQLDEAAVRSLERRPTVFTDFGSAATEVIDDHLSEAVVVDHHEPGREELESGVHVNPHLFGVDGSTELCGATTTYLVAREMGNASFQRNECSNTSSEMRCDNRDLADVAVVGAVGDIQARGGLSGVNREVLRDGEEAGVLEERRDLSLFGKQTRPVHKMLQFSGDPFIPGVTGDEEGARGVVEAAGVELKRGEEWRRWIDLSGEEQRAVVSELMNRLLRRGWSDSAERLVGETYVLTTEEPGTETRDASEYSTLLNATARYGESEVGLAVCLGDRDEALGTAHTLLKHHRRNLVQGLEFVERNGVTRLENLQYFHAGDEILDTVVGIVAGMSVNLDPVDRSVPILAFAESDDGVKVSSRGTGSLVRKGLNLAEAMRLGAEAVGGGGGGHDVAAGATVPEGSEEEFLEVVDRVVGEQLG